MQVYFPRDSEPSREYSLYTFWYILIPWGIKTKGVRPTCWSHPGPNHKRDRFLCSINSKSFYNCFACRNHTKQKRNRINAKCSHIYSITSTEDVGDWATSSDWQHLPQHIYMLWEMLTVGRCKHLPRKMLTMTWYYIWLHYNLHLCDGTNHLKISSTIYQTG